MAVNSDVAGGCLPTTVVLGDTITCSPQARGATRYNPSLELVQVCTSDGWVNIGNSKDDQGAGLTKETARPSCQAIRIANPQAKDGIYWVMDPLTNLPIEIYCLLEMGVASTGIYFGTGAQGKVELLENREYFIDEIFPNYDPLRNMVPHFDTLLLANGARLTVAPYNKVTGSGGVLAFYVKNKLSIMDDRSFLDVSAKGHAGGVDIQTIAGYAANTMNSPGDGPAGGAGGHGGDPAGCLTGAGATPGSGSHGSGAGGGSFFTEGSEGTYDYIRCLNLAPRPAGPLVKLEEARRLWTTDSFLEMGSGGGASGPGHYSKDGPSRSSCPPFRGGRGGGKLQVYAREIALEGTGTLISFRATGEGGLPQSPTCLWPNSNPQVGKWAK